MTIESQQQLLERAVRLQQDALDRASGGKRKHVYSHTDLGKDIGINRQAVSQLRYGGPMSAEVALRLAKIMRDDPTYVVAIANHNKALRLGRMDELAVWEKIAKTFKR